MKFLFFSILMLIGMPSIAQSNFDKSIDPENQDVVLCGKISFDDIQKEPSFSWFQSGEKEYSPQANAITFLKQTLPSYDLIVFLGTWCDDSKLQIPHLYKILNEVNFPFKNVQLYGVNRAKKAKNGEEQLYKIEFVPTIILLKDGKEIGRMVEAPQASIEEDLMKMMTTNSEK